LQKRILTYHHYLHVHHNPVAYDALFTGLSATLLVELKLFLFRELFMEKASFFRDCHPDLIQKIVIGLKECTYSPGDIIILKGWIGDSMFFIVKGKCDVLNQNNCAVAMLQSGDHFGEIALIYDIERNATVRAATYCVLGKLEKTAYDEIMEDHPEERERMRLIAEARMADMRSRQQETVPVTVMHYEEDDHAKPLLGRVRQSIFSIGSYANTIRSQFSVADSIKLSARSIHSESNVSVIPEVSAREHSKVPKFATMTTPRDETPHRISSLSALTSRPRALEVACTQDRIA